MDYGAIAEVAAAVVTTVATIADMKKRRQFEEALAELNQKQLTDLNNRMLAAQTVSARLAILSQSIVEYTLENKRRDERNKITMIVAATALALVLAVAIFYNISKKK